MSMTAFGFERISQQWQFDDLEMGVDIGAQPSATANASKSMPARPEISHRLPCRRRR
jgi:hypothetical protein